MPKFNIPYVHDDTIVYPIKLSSLLSKLCNQVGLELGNTDFPNADYMVVGNPFTNGEDCRTVLSNIAQLAGGFAKIGRDDKVYIRTLRRVESDLLKVKDVHNMKVQELNSIPVKKLSSYRDSTDEAIDGNNYFEDFSKNNEWGELNSLVIGLSDIEGENTAIDDKDSINKNGLTELSILDNYFLIDQKEREKVITPLWNNLKGLKYLPFKTKYYGYPHIDSGDVITIEDSNDNIYVSYVLNHTFTFNGAFNGNIDTPAMTKTQTAYKNTQNTKSMLKRAERKIDKVNGLIEDVLEEQTETNDKLSQHEQTIGKIKDTVKSTEKNLKDNYYTKTETESQITQKADSITSEVSKNITEAKQDAINSSNSATDEKLKNYTTKTEMNSKIEQTAESITSTVTNITETVENMENTAISSVTVMYAPSISQTVAPTEGWSEKAPEWKEGQYIWQKTITKYVNGKSLESKATCISGIDGKNGIGIKSITPQYYLSSSNTETINGEWKDTQDPYIEGYYYWTRNKIVWEDGTEKTTDPILDTGINDLNKKINETSSNLTQYADSIDANVRQTIRDEYQTYVENGYLSQDQADNLKEELKGELATLKNSVEQRITSDAVTTKIEKAIEEIHSLITEIVTINDKGITIEKKINGADGEFSANYNETGVYFKSYGRDIAKYTKDGAFFDSLQITGELKTANLRIIDLKVNGENRTHIHWIGG